MPTYKPSSVQVTVLDNPRIINLGETVRIPAIVGLGPMTRSVVDEAVVRATGSVDFLGAYPGLGVQVTQIANTPNINGGVSATSVSNNGALYSMTSASVGGAGTVTWPQGVTGVNVPATGSTYYVSYAFSVPTTQFNPVLFADKDSLQAQFGTQDNNDSILTVAGLLALENGSPAVLCVQASGSSYNEQIYKDAIDKLETKSNIEYLVVVFPSGSVTLAQQQSLVTYAITHVNKMNNPAIGKERGMILGSPSAFFASTGGFDVIGDTSTVPSYVSQANAYKSKNITYVVPSRVYRKNDSGITMELDANFAAAAIAGLHCGQSTLTTPIHGFTLAGITLDNEKWNDTQMNILGAGSCLVLDFRNGVVTVRDAITTDPSSANTQELSVVSQERLVKRTLRTGLSNTYTNKGKVITPSTPRDVEATTRAILQSLVNGGELFSFGQQDNPTTGELKISAKQNAQEPRQIDVTCAVKYLYPLKFVNVTVSTFV